MHANISAISINAPRNKFLKVLSLILLPHYSQCLQCLKMRLLHLHKERETATNTQTSPFRDLKCCYWRKWKKKTNLWKVHKIRQRLLLPCLSKHAMLQEWPDKFPATSAYVHTILWKSITYHSGSLKGFKQTDMATDAPVYKPFIFQYSPSN